MDDSAITSASAKDKEQDGIGIEVSRDQIISSDGRDMHNGGLGSAVPWKRYLDS